MRLAFPVALLSLLASATAQVNTAAQLVGGAVQSGANAAPMPVGTNVWNGLSRSCTSSCGTSQIAAGHAGTLLGIDIVWVAGCQATMPGAVLSEATVRYDLSSPIPIPARIIVSWTPSSAGTGTSQLDIDLGADGIVDANGAAILPVSLGPVATSLQIHVACQATAGVLSGPFGSSFPYTGSAGGNLTVRLEPTHCLVQPVGPACGVSQFGAAGTFLRGCQITGNVPFGHELAVLVLGFAQTAATVPLPPNCMLHVDPAILVGQFTYGASNATWTMTLGPSLLPVTFRAQMFDLDLDGFLALGSQPLLVQWQ